MKLKKEEKVRQALYVNETGLCPSNNCQKCIFRKGNCSVSSPFAEDNISSLKIRAGKYLKRYCSPEDILEHMV